MAGRGAQILVILIVAAFFTACAQSRDPMSPTLSDPQPRLFGAFVYRGVWSGMAPVEELERSLDFQLDIVHWFTSWDGAWDEGLVAMAAQQGRRPLISWEPHRQPVPAIAAGYYDDYLRAWARGAAAYGKVIYLRPFPEMNGNWTPWNGNAPALVAAWQRVVTLFRQEGADNVKWVWSPNLTDEPRTPENSLERYYPGDAYVDILALSGFNWGTGRPWSYWRSFEEIFAVPYERIARLGSQPVWIPEIASTEQGGDKAAWVSEMLASTAFPRLEAIVWFDQDKELDWHIKSSDRSLQAFREGLAGKWLMAQR